MLKYKIEKKIMKLEEEKKEVAAKLKPEQKGSFSKFFLVVIGNLFINLVLSKLFTSSMMH